MVLSVIDVTGRDNCHAGYDVIAFDTSIRLSPRQRLFQGTIRLQCISVCEACAQGVIRSSYSRDQDRSQSPASTCCCCSSLTSARQVMAIEMIRPIRLELGGPFVSYHAGTRLMRGHCGREGSIQRPRVASALH